MAYLYRHIRKDKNEVFYIGIAEDFSGKYVRAHDVRSRNRYWKHIISKTEYIVEIVLDELTWEEACEKEKEFIKLYGRKDLNEGTLVNLTNGGEGLNNPSIITKQLISSKIKKIWNTRSESERRRLREINSESVRLSRKNAGIDWQLEHNTKVRNGWNNRSDEDKEQYKALAKHRAKEQWRTRTVEDIEIISNKISKTLKGKFAGISKPQQYVICPHCGKYGGQSNMTRYHFNNCKNKQYDE